MRAPILGTRASEHPPTRAVVAPNSGYYAEGVNPPLRGRNRYFGGILWLIRTGLAAPCAYARRPAEPPNSACGLFPALAAVARGAAGTRPCRFRRLR